MSQRADLRFENQILTTHFARINRSPSSTSSKGFSFIDMAAGPVKAMLLNCELSGLEKVTLLLKLVVVMGL